MAARCRWRVDQARKLHSHVSALQEQHTRLVIEAVFVDLEESSDLNAEVLLFTMQL